MESKFFNTAQVARRINIPHTTLSRAVWAGDIKAPQRSPGGAYLWTEADCRRAGEFFGYYIPRRDGDHAEK